MHGTVFVFAKAPRAGAVKTRLAADIGDGRAAALFRIMTKRIAAEAAKGRWRVIIAVDPASAMSGWSNIFPPHLPRALQARGDLGARMGCAFAAAPPGPAVIIGTDIPALRARHMRAAFDALAGADAVFGPAEDGGYWLIGLARRRPAPDLFKGVRWSGPHALADTIDTLPASFRVKKIERLADVDDADDLSHFGLRATAR